MTDLGRKNEFTRTAYYYYYYRSSFRFTVVRRNFSIKEMTGAIVGSLIAGSILVGLIIKEVLKGDYYE